MNRHSTGPDFSKLFIGAEGTLGIITEILCKIYPLPEKRAFLSFPFTKSQGWNRGGKKDNGKRTSTLHNEILRRERYGVISSRINITWKVRDAS